jgi:hypothetical protein
VRHTQSEGERSSGIKAPSPSPLPAEARFPALNALLFLICLNFALQPLTEPDFGWHLRAGVDFFKQGWTLPAVDPYSHTMADWVWVEHAWLTDVIIAGIYSLFGGLGVILFFGAITISAWLLASRLAPCGVPFRWLACVLSLWVALPYLGARTQLITLLGLSVLLLFLKRWQAGNKWPRWSIPPLFLLWANLHGAFTAGLLLLGLMIVTTAVVSRMAARRILFTAGIDEILWSSSDLRQLVIVTVLSTLVTFMNPYGWRLHAEIIDSLSNQFMLDSLQEWQSFSTQGLAGRSYALYLSGLGLAMALWYRRIEPVRWVIGVCFLALSFRHMRNIPFFLLFSLPLCAELLAIGFDRLEQWARPWIGAVRNWGMIGTVAAGLMLLWLGPEHLHHVIHSGVRPAEYFRETSYPIEAVEWVQTHRDQVGHRLYNDYAYGGFLLWWLPEEKIFIDGRMPAWQRGTRRIFHDYVALTLADPPDLTVLKKYFVDWAIVRKNSPLDQRIAKEAAWTRVYEDEKVSLYRLLPERR